MASRSNETSRISNLGSSNENSHWHIQGVIEQNIQISFFSFHICSAECNEYFHVQSRISTRGNRTKSSA